MANLFHGGQKYTKQSLEILGYTAIDTTPEGTGATDMSPSQDLSAGCHSKAETPKLDEDCTSGQLEGTLGGYWEGAADDASHVSITDGMAWAATDDWETEEGLTNQAISLADESLLEVYGNSIHWNGSQHLHGGIREG